MGSGEPAPLRYEDWVRLDGSGCACTDCSSAQTGIPGHLAGWATIVPSSSGRAPESLSGESGYSEGANQTAYNVRHITPSPHGMILISGGGDLEGPNDSTTSELAMWMTDDPLVEDRHAVGLRNVNELADFTEGWTLDGLRTDEVQDVQDIDDHWAGFATAHRLVRTDQAGDPEAAHGSTVWSDKEMKGVHMYLACKAASG